MPNSITLKIAFSLGLLGVSIAAMLHSIDQSRTSAAMIEHTYQLLDLSKAIQTSSLEHKSFVSANRALHKEGLRQLNQLRKNISDNLSQIRDKTAENPALQQQLKGISSTFNAIINESDSHLPSKGGLIMLGPTISIVAEGQPEHLNATLIKQLREFDTTLQQYSQIQVESARRNGLLAEQLMLFSLLAGTSILLITLRDFRIEVNQRKEAEERWKFALEGSGDGVWDWDLTTDQTYYSRRWGEMLGYSENEIGKGMADWEDRLHPDDRHIVLARVQDYFDGKTPLYSSEHRVLRKDGSYQWIQERGMIANRNADGGPRRMIGTQTDIAERKKAELELQIAAIAFNAQEGMLVTDASNIILRANPAFTSITGYSAAEVVGQNPSMLSSGKHDAAFYTAMWDSIHKTGTWQGEIWNRRKNGEIFPEFLNITAVTDKARAITNYVATMADITMSKAAAQKIELLAFYDPLTHLPNRRLLQDRLDQAMVSSARSGKNGALLFIDLDDFKTLNDTKGHDFGDALLQQVAERLTDCVREGDTVARLGGDEFVVMLEDLKAQITEAAPQAEVIATKILSALNKPYQLDTEDYVGSCSIGIALFTAQEQTKDELLKHADIAMYQAKRAGRNALRFFDPEMQASIAARLDMENSLRHALADNQFQLYYQMQVTQNNQVVGAEVLVRWQHPEHGLVQPDAFIPLAEKTGIIVPIGQWVMDSACARLQTWQQDPVKKNLTLSVNVSASQFRQTEFVQQVKASVERYGINPSRLKLEPTESLLLENVEHTIEAMHQLKKIGIQFSLDDFGTGYSSLQYLKKLPLDQLKIDKSFVRDIASDSNDKAIVITIIAMANSMGLDVIAEGVETEEQRQLLIQNGCSHLQGYLFSKPIPIEHFEALLMQQNARQENYTTPSST